MFFCMSSVLAIRDWDAGQKLDRLCLRQACRHGCVASSVRVTSVTSALHALGVK